MRAIVRRGTWPGLLFVLLGLVACGGRPGPAGRLSDAGWRDGGTSLDAAPRDAPAADRLPSGDATDPCPCSTDVSYRPTYQFGECVPPLQLGCEARECTPGVTDCGDGYTCEQWGAAACCYCEQAVPACLLTEPTLGPLPEYLKIEPVFGPPQTQQTVTIAGFPFYIGALFYLARVGDSGDLFQGGGTTCSFDVTVPPHAVGMAPVWVSQYGGDDPWVLAGFFTFSEGDYPTTCVQPGYPCISSTPCCATPDVPMGCAAGRCRRQ